MAGVTILRTTTLAAAVLLYLMAGCSGGDEHSAVDNDGGGQTSGAVAVGSDPGDRAPDFLLRRVDGGNLSLSSLKGKAVILDFWDTWCPPCRRALPHLQELSEIYADELVVVGVALAQEGEAKVRSFINDRDLTFEMVLFNQDIKLARDFGGLQSLPTTFLIDAEGVIRAKWIGAVDKSTYEKAVRDVIGA